MASEPLCGGISDDLEIHKEEHVERINAALASTDGHAGRPYKLHRVTQQIVAGTLHTYYISFEDGQPGQQYKITVWDRLWLKEKDPTAWRKVTFEAHSE
uniref:Cystatin domain-containing protein n=1 Tax=Anopheles farauti TaxID=69004 RepID=A0A182QQ82_9DIPT